MIKITKNDILWNYFGTILNIAMGVIILPFILKMLSTKELGLWYVFGSIAALVSLIDFGFSPSLMRNIIYAWSGVKELKSEGLSTLTNDSNPNIELVFNLINANKKIYLVLAIFAGAILLIIGTPYIYTIISFEEKYIVAWGIYSIGIVFNLYYSYWSPLLRGIGAIKEDNQVIVISRSIYIVFTIIGLTFGWGIIWLSLMYVLNSLLVRVLAKQKFSKILRVNSYRNEVLISTNAPYNLTETLKIIWPNAKKQGLVTIGGWLITRSSTLICSYFYGLEVTAQYGLSLQVLSIVCSFSVLLYVSYSPEIASVLSNGNKKRYIELFSRSILVQWLISIIGILTTIFIVPELLKFIGSNSSLLPKHVLVVLGLVLFLEWNHSTFAGLITLGNRVPFVASSLLSGVAIVSISFFLAMETNFGVFSLIIAQGLVQLSYNNWYWPRYVCIQNNITLFKLAKNGLIDIYRMVK